ncbi:DNA-directed RNA polymerase subunit E [Tubulinosema ratisbonensis]|uniref:DNA-directed RNA polymerase subunit E n=1 Tax=Tubulinosema ratisbonensis TaxID=291195 RepID=A0A437AIG5_9MICR|nr:DNA-directed RNA polymerase subunit E [Tubulinosema ratisbonensis]
MLIKIDLQDKVLIPLSSQKINTETLNSLNKKYANKLTKTGLCICIPLIKKIHYKKIIESAILVKVTFEGLFYRLFSDELCIGKVVQQNEDGILVDVKFIGSVCIPKRYLDEEFSVKQISTNFFCWFWKYNENFLYFYNDDIVRFKVVIENDKIFGRINETGLGPLSWWE